VRIDCEGVMSAVDRKWRRLIRYRLERISWKQLRNLWVGPAGLAKMIVLPDGTFQQKISVCGRKLVSNSISSFSPLKRRQSEIIGPYFALAPRFCGPVFHHQQQVRSKEIPKLASSLGYLLYFLAGEFEQWRSQ
jgi:hypothetical protein